MSAPPENSGGISFGKRVGEGTSMAVDRMEQVAAHDQMQAQLVDVQATKVPHEKAMPAPQLVCRSRPAGPVPPVDAQAAAGRAIGSRSAVEFIYLRRMLIAS
jgi:hypothetical protein